MIEESDIIKKVRRIEIRAKGLSRQLFSGEYHSAFKGRGMSFSEVREYQFGDDIRNIDWNVTARLSHPYVKIFEEERELTVMLLVDVSGSNNFGTQQQLKKDLLAEVAATLAFSAIANNDKVGVIFFSDQIERFIPPKKGSSHILRIIRELITFEPQSKGTDISEALRYFTNITKKRCSAFLLSDCRDSHFEDALKIASRKHDLSVLHIVDDRESEMPNIGLVRFCDSETGVERWIDTSDASVRSNYARQSSLRQSALATMLRKYGIDTVQLRTGQDFVKPLIKLFDMRQS